MNDAKNPRLYLEIAQSWLALDKKDKALEVLMRAQRMGIKNLGVGELLENAREIGFTVVSISLSLVTVFTPILLMGGIVGRLFREFAVTLSVAIVVSLGVSLTATPMMCSRLLKQHRKENEGKFYRASGEVFDWMLRVYERSLAWVLRHPAFTLSTLVVTIGVNVCLFVLIPKGFFPQQDTGVLQGRLLGAQNTSFQAMQAAMLRIVDIVKADPAVATVTAFTGGSTATDTGNMFISLKPRSQRDASADQVINRLRRPTSKVAGAHVVPPGRPGPADRRPGERRAVPIHDRERQPAGPGHVGARSARADEETAWTHRCQQRSAQRRASGSPRL